jgi:short-subunit dehydrogenase
MVAAKMLLEKYGPWALVTGASSGIGEQFARRLARAGFSLLLVARRADRLEALARELGKRRRIDVVALAADLADRAAIDRVTAAAASRDLGLIVSNAGLGLKGRFVKLELDALEAMVEVNALAPLRLLHALLPRLLQRGRGGMVLTGSVEGEAPFPWSSAYAATKAFVLSLGLGLSGELEGTGVDLLVLEPGATDTEALRLQGFAPETIPNLMSPAEVARQALAQLGRVALHIPGKENRKFVSAMRRMPKDKLVVFNAANMSAALAASARPAKS